MEQLQGVPDDEVRMIGFETAMRHFRFDPFAHRPPERCTVAALRAEAEGVDTTPRSSGRSNPRPERPVLIADITALSGAAR